MNPERLKPFAAEYSLAELESVSEQVHRDWQSLRAEGIELNAAEVEISRNRMLVSLQRIRDQDLELLRRRTGAVELQIGPGIGQTGA